MSKLVQTNRVGKLKNPVVLEFENGDRIEIEAWVEVAISITVDGISTASLKEATYEELCIAFTEATGIHYQSVSRKTIIGWAITRQDLFVHDAQQGRLFHRPSPEPTSNLKPCTGLVIKDLSRLKEARFEEMRAAFKEIRGGFKNEIPAAHRIYEWIGLRPDLFVRDERSGKIYHQSQPLAPVGVEPLNWGQLGSLYEQYTGRPYPGSDLYTVFDWAISRPDLFIVNQIEDQGFIKDLVFLKEKS